MQNAKGADFEQSRGEMKTAPGGFPHFFVAVFQGEDQGQFMRGWGRLVPSEIAETPENRGRGRPRPDIATFMK
jgi:hypothetical protein